MQPKDRARESIARPVEIEHGSKPAGGWHALRRRANASKVPGMQVRRILVLAERFRALCALKSDPVLLADLLRGLIACSRETFGTEAAGELDEQRAEQIKCLHDLELLVQGLVRGAPESSRGLAHAMDALLIQCVVFQAGASDAPRASESPSD